MASAVEYINDLMICDLVRMAPLFGGNIVLFDKKKCPPDQLHASNSLMYPELLCVASVIYLCEYVRTACYCAAIILSILFMVFP